MACIIADALKRAIAEEMQGSAGVLPHRRGHPGGMGGAFTVTKGLGEEFGKNGFEHPHL